MALGAPGYGCTAVYTAVHGDSAGSAVQLVQPIRLYSYTRLHGYTANTAIQRYWAIRLYTAVQYCIYGYTAIYSIPTVGAAPSTVGAAPSTGFIEDPRTALL